MTGEWSTYPEKTTLVGEDILAILDSTDPPESSTKNKIVTFSNALKKWFAPVDANNNALKLSEGTPTQIDGAGLLTLPDDGNVFNIAANGATDALNLLSGDNWPAGTMIVIRCDSALINVMNNAGGQTTEFRKIFLASNDDFSMGGGDTLTLVKVSNDFWVETARMDKNRITTKELKFFNQGLGADPSIICDSPTNEITLPNTAADGRLKSRQGPDLVPTSSSFTLGDGNFFRILAKTHDLELISKVNWQPGSTIIIMSKVDDQIIKHGSTSSGDFITLNLQNSANHTLNINDTIEFVFDTNQWAEISRSNNDDVLP